MHHCRTNYIHALVAMDEGSRVIRDVVEEGFVCVLQFVCSVWEGEGEGGSVKGTHAQTRLSLGITVACSSPLFNCHGRGVRLGTIAPQLFIMGQFVVVFAVQSHKYHTSYTLTQQMGGTQMERGEWPDCDFILT